MKPSVNSNLHFMKPPLSELLQMGKEKYPFQKPSGSDYSPLTYNNAFILHVHPGNNPFETLFESRLDRQSIGHI